VMARKMYTVMQKLAMVHSLEVLCCDNQQSLRSVARELGVDGGIARPLKARVRNLWEDWMVEQGNRTVRFNPPSRQTVASWVVPTLCELESEIIINSWRHQPYSYFENEVRTGNDKSRSSNNNSDESDTKQRVINVLQTEAAEAVPV
jgi:hypothetical protein